MVVADERIEVDGSTMTLETVQKVARRAQPLECVLTASAQSRITKARRLVEARARSDVPTYGLNTGFGYLAQVKVASEDLQQLQYNLIRSHSVGVGAPLCPVTTRALMLLRANVMATGRSGVRLETVSLLLSMLNRDILPVVPSKGSVGASGDLAPLAHIALAMLGEGEVFYEGKRQDSGSALRACGLSPLVPGVKEGLCLINGTQAMTAVGTLTVLAAQELCKLADIVGAVSLEGDLGTPVAFDQRIHQSRPHPGQRDSAFNLRKLLDGSEIRESHEDCDRIQDPYSFRCMPQVHGATRDTVAFVRRTLEIEVNSATDNPLVFAEPDEDQAMLSGGNFHGQPIALGLDFLAIAVSELANISDRRVDQLIDPRNSQLPAFLVENPGLNSGFMMAQVTAASLVNENKVLAFPASVDSIPTSAGREDHVSMGMTSARKAEQVLSNAQTCLAIELLCGCQALDLVGMQPGIGVAAAYRAVRRKVPKLDGDRVLAGDIDTVTGMLADGTVLKAVEREIGQLA